MEIIKFDDENVLTPIKPTELSGNTEMVDVAAINKALEKPTELSGNTEMVDVAAIKEALEQPTEIVKPKTEEVVSINGNNNEQNNKNIFNMMNFAYVYGSSYKQFVQNITNIVSLLEKADLAAGAYDAIAEQISSVPEVYGYDSKSCEQKDINSMKVLGAKISEYQSAQVNTNSIKYGDVMKEVEAPILGKKM